MLSPLHIWAIVGLIIALIIAIVVWTIVGIEYKRILDQRKIDRLILRISKRAEDSGNESDGDQEELSALIINMGNDNPGYVNDL
uniref:Protein Vpu n=1 Tax=Human immunodeficiency virus type 1 TaxID=11676 RepID=A0A0M4AGC4_HV1|nr:vpu protein [Human immunodeficiency virus 1]